MVKRENKNQFKAKKKEEFNRISAPLVIGLIILIRCKGIQDR